MVRYLPIDRELVSAEWHAVLMDMRRQGVHFNVNEGHRTMARQWYFWNNQGKPGFNLAAYPSPFAPHIRTGRIDHAIDFSNDLVVMRWLARAGLRPARTVRGESWHIEVTAERLRWYYAKHHNPLAALSRRGQEAARRLLYHRRGMAKEKPSGMGAKFKSHLRWSRYWKARLQAALLHATGKKRDTIKRVLAATDGRL